MRLLAEVTVFILLLLLPVVILILGKFAALSITVKILVIALAVVSVAILPIYTQLTFQVKLTADELITFCLAARRRCRLSSIKGVKRRSVLGVIRYVVENDESELSFPIWLQDCQGLVALLRESLSGPGGGAAGGGSSVFRTFKQDPVGLIFQMGQSLLSLLFALLIWYFVLSMHHGGHQSSADIGLLYTFALVVSAVLFWRAWVVAMMPCEVEIKPDELLIKTVFKKVAVGWDCLRGIGAPFPLLPEGFFIRTTRGGYLVGQGMDEADELESALKANLDRIAALKKQEENVKDSKN